MAAPTTKKGTARSKSGSSRSKKKKPAKEPPRRIIPRALSVTDEDDHIMSTGAGLGAGYGRCGGRLLGSRLEQTLCDQLTDKGIAHSHSPRHFEVQVTESSVAAYAPLIVLRGRGREGKTVVLEYIEGVDKPLLAKIQAFRRQYGQEFYVTFLASEEDLELVPLSAYDESCTTNDLNNLVNRLAE